MAQGSRKKAQAMPTREVCPHFICFTGREIVCRGIIDGCDSCLRFRSEDGAQQQNTLYCRGAFKYCEQYRAVIHFRWEDAEE